MVVEIVVYTLIFVAFVYSIVGLVNAISQYKRAKKGDLSKGTLKQAKDKIIVSVF